MHENERRAGGRERFDTRVAARYDDFRALPESVTAAIRERIVAATGSPRAGRMLELGSGTGRIARPFLEAGFHYTGVDTSAAMLARLRDNIGRAVAPTLDGAPQPSASSAEHTRPRSHPNLVLGSAVALPFSGAAFDLIVAVQVLGVVPGWRRVVEECARVLRRGGSVVLGAVEYPPDSLHDFVRAERNQLIARLGQDSRRPGARDEEAHGALSRAVGPVRALPLVAWQVEQTPREALDAALSGWRVQALDDERRDWLRVHLAERVGACWGDLDTPRTEQRRFTLHLARHRGV